MCFFESNTAAPSLMFTGILMRDGKFVKERILTHALERSTLNSGKLSENEGAGVRYIGKLDRGLYSCVTSNIATDDVIITAERIQHIKERRGADFLEKYERYFPLILSDPDYIFPDARINTAIVCKVIGEGEEAVNLVLRLVVTGDDPTYKNSILTAIRENKRRFSQRLRNNRPIYKKD